MDRIAHTPTIIFLALALTSCAHGPTVEGPPTIGRSTEGQALPPMPDNLSSPSVPWAQLSFDDRRAYMAEHVVPAMAPLFKAFDPERYDDLSCNTCHGPNAGLHHFRMPNPGLPVLPVPESAGWNAMMSERHHVFSFMAERVEPAVAHLLGVQPYDPSTQQGFGCFNCHTMEGQ